MDIHHSYLEKVIERIENGDTIIQSFDKQVDGLKLISVITELYVMQNKEEVLEILKRKVIKSKLKE